MDKLSPEILSLIIEQLSVGASPAESPRLKNYATVSRRWQHLVERCTFASIKLALNEQGLSTFASVFKYPRRQTLLRKLFLSFDLPARGNLRPGHVANCAALGSALVSLFKLLSAWETDSRTIHVDFCISHRNYTPARRYFMLDQPETVLPTVPCVDSLSIDDGPGTALHPTAAVKLIGSLPNLQTLEYRFYDPDPKRAQLRKEIRKALAMGLNSLELPMLQHLHMTQERPLDLGNHSFDCGDLRDGDGVDPLNSAMLSFSQRSPIKRLNLSAFLVSSELFTGRDPDCAWPTLQQFEIHGVAVAPSGKWYWTGDPTAMSPGSTRGYGSDVSGSFYPSSDSDISWHRDSGLDDSGTEDDDDRDAIRNGFRPAYDWRDKPDWDMISPLLVDMARAVQRMPKLQRGNFNLEHRGFGDVCVQCAAPGFRYEDFDKYEPKSFRTCRFFVGNAPDKDTWLSLEQVPEEVRSAWREWLGDDGEMETGPYWRQFDLSTMQYL